MDSVLTRVGPADMSGNWPSWSPDGRHVVFQSRRNGYFDIWIINDDGSALRQLTDHADHDYLPEWHPDGRRISFTSWRKEPSDTGRAPHFYIMNIDGSDQRRLLSWSPSTSTAAAWSPDGQEFVFSRHEAGSGASIHVARLGEDTSRQLTDGSFYAGSPRYSPDGSRIAFYADHGDRSDIVIMHRDGSGRQVLLGGGRHWYPHWSPDGRWIVCTTAVPNTELRNLDILAFQVDDPAHVIRLASTAARETEARWRPR